MELSPLEHDLVGDLAQDDHGVFEVFYFARAHLRDQPDDAILDAGCALLLSWLERGWLESGSSPYRATAPDDLDIVRDLASRRDRRLLSADDDSIWLRLAGKARSDIPWLNAAR